MLCNPVYSFVYSENESSMDDLARAEKIIFGQYNTRMNPYTRLARAEQTVFGTVQSGDFNSRVNFINQVLDNSNKGKINYYNRQNKINRLKYAVNDILKGSMTGYTPQIYINTLPNGFYNTIPPTPYNIGGNRNFITQTRVIIDN